MTDSASPLPVREARDLEMASVFVFVHVFVHVHMHGCFPSLSADLRRHPTRLDRDPG